VEPSVGPARQLGIIAAAVASVVGVRSARASDESLGTVRSDSQVHPPSASTNLPTYGLGSHDDTADDWSWAESQYDVNRAPHSPSYRQLSAEWSSATSPNWPASASLQGKGGGGGGPCPGGASPQYNWSDPFPLTSQENWGPNPDQWYWTLYMDTVYSRVGFCDNGNTTIHQYDVLTSFHIAGGTKPLDCATYFNYYNAIDGAYPYRDNWLGPNGGYTSGTVGLYRYWDHIWDKSQPSGNFKTRRGGGPDIYYRHAFYNGDYNLGYTCDNDNEPGEPYAVDCWFDGIIHGTWANETTWWSQLDATDHWCGGVNHSVSP